MIGFSITHFGGLIPLNDPKKLPKNAAEEAVDCDFQASDLRAFAPLKVIAHAASNSPNKSGFVFNEDQMFVFIEAVEATYGPVRAEEDKDNRVFIGSGFREWPVYSTKALGLPTPIATYHGPPINWRRLGVIPGPVAPIVSVPVGLSGTGNLFAGNPTVMNPTSGSVLQTTPGIGDAILSGSRIKISAAENEGWERVNNNVYIIDRAELPPPTGEGDIDGRWSSLSLRGLDTSDLIEEGDTPGEEWLEGSSGPFTQSDEINWSQEYEIDQVEDRFYVWTLVTELGEEGPPSLPSVLISVGFGQTVTVETPTTIDDPYRFYETKRIYRTVPTSTGTARYYFVAEIPISQAVFEDNIEVIALGEELQSMEWYPPPDGLEGLIVLPNGVMAGFVDRTLYLSEPYQPHAWPSAYTKNMDNPIVGIAAYGQQVVIGTEENPYIGTASDPLSMTFSKLATVEPCISKRAMQSIGYGVIYPSPNGLMTVTPGGAVNAINKMWDEKAWRALFTADSYAVVHDLKYYLTFYNPDTKTSATVVFDPTADNLQITEISPDNCSGMAVDRDEDRLYWFTTKEGRRLVEEWNPDDGVEDNEAMWMSQSYVLPVDSNLGAMQVFYNRDETGYITVEFIVDGVSRHTATVTTEEPIRLPGGFLGRDWKVRVRATKSVQAVYVAETIAELRGALTR